jgi:membrane protein implicated in regulation of membrane protease activity
VYRSYWPRSESVIRFGPALVVIAVGATFAFAVSPTAIPGINLTVAGIIILLAGVVALLLSARAGRPGHRTMSTRLRPTVHRRRVAETRPDAAVDNIVEGQPVRAGRPRQ